MPKLSTHSAQLERWLGKDNVEHVSKIMRNWYGGPIALAGVPGRVYVGPGGDFTGRITTGIEASALDVAESISRRLSRTLNVAQQFRSDQFASGFTGLSDLIAAATTAGRKRMFSYQKVGVTGTATGQTSTLWQSGNQPIAGAAGSAAPGGRATTSSTTGAMPFANPASGTQHIVSAFPIATVINCTTLLYDRIFDVAKTMASTATESVTGVPTRYTSTTAGAADSAENNFLFIECQTVLPATAHNWTVCKYTNQAGTTNQTLPSVTGVSSCAAQRIDGPATNSWFAPLASGDSGISALTQMQCSASVATGAINFVMGHPLAWLACPIANQVCVYDGVTTAFNFERIFDNACLALLEAVRPTTTAATYTGTIHSVSN